MTAVVWRIRFSAPAERDFLHIIRYTQDHFGTRQSGIYRKLITDALAALQNGPDLPGSLARDEIQPRLRSFHIAKRGKSARHLILYRAGEDHVIEIIRILHDAMELTRHIPSDDE